MTEVVSHTVSIALSIKCRSGSGQGFFVTCKKGIRSESAFGHTKDE